MIAIQPYSSRTRTEKCCSQRAPIAQKRKEEKAARLIENANNRA
jgi:hypothetical protein